MLINGNHSIPIKRDSRKRLGQKQVLKAHGKGRSITVLSLFALAFVGVVARGVFMLTSGAEHLKAEGDKRFIRTEKLSASRGMITDRNGATLALSVPAYALSVEPMFFMQIPSPAGMNSLKKKNAAEYEILKNKIKAFASEFGMTEQELTESLQNGNNNFIEEYRLSETQIERLKAAFLKMPSAEEMALLSRVTDKSELELTHALQDVARNSITLKRQLSKADADALRALKFKGFVFTTETKRHYPMGNVFSQFVGFTNSEGVGAEGLEAIRNKELQGIDGLRTVLRDRKGNVVDNVDSANNTEPQDGKNVVLALDQRIQVLAYNELNKVVKHHNAKAGSAVVLDAKTGEVLAMVSNPSFDPNSASKGDADTRRMRPLMDMFEPGSVFKPLTVAKAVNDGKVNANTWFGTSSILVGDKVIRDTHDYPSLTVRGILQKSSNVGTAKIAMMYTPKEMRDFYLKLGMGQKVGWGFGETSGAFLRARDQHGNPREWYPVEQAIMSYGYGVQASLLQMARAYTVFTADGNLLPVSWRKLDAAPQGEPVISAKAAAQMREMMAAATEKGGTGIAGAVDGFDVGAKTGTARKAGGGKAHSANRHIATFIGFAPAQNPRVIVAVSVDEPRSNGYYGGTVSGPAFKGIMSGSLNILGVSPTKPLTESGEIHAASQ
ncbi:MAG: penicillin-binding protein 2 [Neisseria sp.]|nr:penicillin-binding protein 2 [Neisseria sp.]